MSRRSEIEIEALRVRRYRQARKGQDAQRQKTGQLDLHCHPRTLSLCGMFINALTSIW